MKRIFSKKSGFTLVEIIVAFAVFAIMSTMILSMVDLTVKQKSKNTEFASSVDEQTGYLTYHYIDKDDKYDPTKDTGSTQFQLSFYDKSNALVCDVSMKYAMRSSVEDSDNAGEGINYFVGNADYTETDDLGGGGGGGSDPISGIDTGSQVSRYDSRLFGSKNLECIQIHKVVKDTTYDVSGQSRYFIECSAKGESVDSAGTVPKEDVPYLQYKLRFVSSKDYNMVDGKSSDGKTYTYKIYEEAPILECGYVTTSDLVWNDMTCEDYRLHTTKNGDDYTIEKTSDCIIRISIPLAYGKTSSGFAGSNHTRLYVVFDGDPELTIDSFGANSNGGKYEVYIDDAGEYNLNIYGAFPYEKTLKAGS